MSAAPKRPAVLICRPDHFAVAYVINPWMEGHIGRTDLSRAKAQWSQLVEIIERFARVEIIEPAEQLPDMCFAANAGLVIENRFIASSFRVSQRRGEEPLYAAWFRSKGFEVLRTPDDQPFEGEGDALVHPGEQVVWAGYGVRSSLESHRTLAEAFNIDVVSLRLVDERFYHLDTCLYPLPGGRLVYYPPAFDEPSLREIHRRIPADRRIEVQDDDALRFACNALRLGETIITNYASPDLQSRLAEWGYDVISCPVDEFMLAGGAVKCLTLLLEQDLHPDFHARPRISSPIQTTRFTLTGHLLDTGLLNRVMDSVSDLGGSCRVEQFEVGQRRDQASQATLRLTAPNAERLDILSGQLMALGAKPVAAAADAVLNPVVSIGVAPDSFYATTIYPTEIRVAGRWIRVSRQRMDAVIVVDNSRPIATAECRLIRDLAPGELVVCGVTGVRVLTSTESRAEPDFGFMRSSVSSERRVELAVDSLAWEMRRIRSRQGKIVVVAGPVVIHTGGGRHLVSLIERGYVQTLLTGNALPVHDIELNLYGTSLGVDLARGVGIHGGHTHHLRAINLVRAAGSIEAAVRQGWITGGVMHACVIHGVQYVLAGSIRDDGPLPDTIMDLVQAQAAYADAVRGAEMILMLSSMLHAIGTGNMTPAGVRLVCVDISPAVVTKLADRGSVESTGIVTDVGLFLNLLAARLT
jgi:lysine-ketoglutarate reductase/saccharopine dehydrogenase-like protein (TIGR00300 family)